MYQNYLIPKAAYKNGFEEKLIIKNVPQLNTYFSKTMIYNKWKKYYLFFSFIYCCIQSEWSIEQPQ